MKKLTLEPRKQPRQQRSSATLALILEAAARVLERESLAGFNTNRVAAVAGISIGSLYQYFPNKTALIAALIEQSHEHIISGLTALMEASSRLGLTDMLHALARFAISEQYARPVLSAALDHEERRLPPQPTELHTQAAITALLEQLIGRYRHDLALDAALPDSAARDCMVIAKALLEADAMSGRAPPADLETRIVRALSGYLRPPI